MKLSAFPEVGCSETLYSVSARLHYLLGHGSHEVTSRLLFGFNNAARLKDFPRGVRNFCDVVGGALGTPQMVIEQRTLAGLYLKFCSPERRLTTQAVFLEPQGAVPSRVLGRGASLRTGSMRACNQCMAYDLAQFGVTTWRIEHQLASALVCTRHGVPLTSFDTGGSNTSHWFRPQDCQSAANTRHFLPETLTWLVNLASVGEILRTHSRATEEILRILLATQLSHRDIIATSRRTKSVRLEKWWQATFDRVGALTPQLCVLKDSTWIRKLILGRCKGDPFRWTTLASALLDADELRILLSQKLPVQQDLDGEWQLQGTPRQDALDPAVWAALVSDLSIAQVEKEFSIPARDLRHWLRLNPYFAQARADAMAASNLARRRATISKIIEDFGDQATRAFLMSSASAEVRWLEQHDRSWITAKYAASSKWSRQALLPF